MSKVLASKFLNDFVDTADLCCSMGWNERNGGNISYRMKDEEVAYVKSEFTYDRPWMPIGVKVENLKNEFFLVTGSGKYFRYTKADPEDNVCIAEIDDKGENYRVVWGLRSGGRPTSEFPTHLLNHSVKKEQTNGLFRIVLHAHPVNIVALTFVLPQDDKVFTRELWEMMPESMVAFPKGIAVLPLMLTGSIDIANATAEKLKKFDVVVWSMHGIFASGGDDFKDVFSVIETVEKAAKMLVKVISMGGKKIHPHKEQMLDVGRVCGLEVNEDLLD